MEKQRVNFYLPDDVVQWLRNEIPSRGISSYVTNLIRRQMRKSQRRPTGYPPET